jgi:hypothetical protein
VGFEVLTPVGYNAADVSEGNISASIFIRVE